MLTLLLLRHAKSDWAKSDPDDTTGQDVERALSSRGRRDAPRMGAYIAAHGPEPDRVLCSTAVRTRETWGLIAPALTKAAAIEFRPELYLAEPMALLTVVRDAPAICKTLLLIGHNPGLHALALWLAGTTGDSTRRKALAAKFPTAALAVLQFPAHAWAAVKPGSGRLVDFMTPRTLDDAG
jgi:phosphohistidine phosphatase